MPIKTVHLVFKTHLDVGFTDLAANVVRHYFDTFIPGALALDMVDPAQMWISLAIGLGGGLLISVAGAWDVLRLDVQ